jgi:hypothetical protein
MNNARCRQSALWSLHFLWRAWRIAGVLALVLAAALAGWLLYAERMEERRFWEQGSLDDGPYVFRLDSNRAKILTVRGDRQRREFLVSEAVYDTRYPETIPPQLRPALTLIPERPEEPFCELPFPSGRLAAFSDVHGQLSRFRKLLAQAGVIGQDGLWTFGSGHLVIAGDVFDKGTRVTETLWFIWDLEQQAIRHGGRVHYLLGNHEHLALTGRSQSVHYKYRLISESAAVPYDQLFSRQSELGRWLRTKNSLVKIGNRLFVHGGLSPECLALKLSLSDMNRLIRLSLDPERYIAASFSERRAADFLAGRQGPLWWDGQFYYFAPFSYLQRLIGDLAETSAGRQSLETVLERFGVTQVVVGHSYTNRVQKMYGGRLLALCLNWKGLDTPSATTVGQLVVWDRAGAESLVTLP